MTSTTDGHFLPTSTTNERFLPTSTTNERVGEPVGSPDGIWLSSGVGKALAGSGVSDELGQDVNGDSLSSGIDEALVSSRLRLEVG